MTHIEQTLCEEPIYWVDLDLIARCVLPDGHKGSHRDYTRWFTAAGIQTPQDPRPRGAR